ncbi:MAG: FAD-dependent oxidoreductase, partial [Chloroflexota bacterium]
MDRPTSWTEETEVVVVGYGGAGAVTAISAHDAGAKVLLVEKQPADTPTATNHTPSTRMCGGAWLSPRDADSAEKYFRGLARIANETVDAEREEYIKGMAGLMVDNTKWIRSIGGVIGDPASFSPTQASPERKEASDHVVNADFGDLPGSDSCYMYYCKAGGGYRHGAALFKTFSDAIDGRKVPVMWDTPVEHLVVEGGVVRGVVGRRNGKTVAIRASRGVVLCSGGFEFNQWMKENYLRVSPVHFYGNPGNTGDGINMSLEVGAALWHMNSMACRVTIKVPELPVAFGTQHHEEKGIFVDKRGVRFSNERFKMHAFGYELTGYDCYAMTYPRVPSYWIIDEKRRKSGPLPSYHGACNPPRGVLGPIHYVWSEDNQAEIDKGWIMKAGTIEELAARIAADPDNNGLMTASCLRTTVRRYNQLCHKGEDKDF